MTATREAAERVDRLLADADADLDARYPGADTSRQPVHSVYIPAHRFDARTLAQWGEQAQQSVDDAGGVDHLLDVHGLVPAGAERDRIGALVEHKLATEPVEDLRVDLEDGFGDVPDDVEDAAVDATVDALAELGARDDLPPFVGIRFKCFERPTRARGIRTLTRFVAALAARGELPDGLVLTLPKVTSVAQVEAMVALLEAMEADLGVPRLDFEIQVETAQSILGPDGTSLLPPMIAAGRGRVTGMPYGTYDYSASLGIAAADQSMEHAAADHAKAVMQAAAAGTRVRLSDGSTNVLPVGTRAEIDAAWHLHGRLVTRSLHRGFYQGWDLHPAQLPSRYAATYAFFRTGLADIVHRLDAYLAKREGAVMDEPATARAMASFLVRGLDCGAVAVDEIGLDEQLLRALLRPVPTPG